MPDIVDDTSDKAGTAAVGLPTMHQSSVVNDLLNLRSCDLLNLPTAGACSVLLLVYSVLPVTRSGDEGLAD